jgi:hypothetical protein
MKGSGGSKGFLIFTVFIGAIGGSFLGDILGSNINFLSFLKSVYTIGTTNSLILDLRIIKLTLGLNINLSIMSILGMFLAIILFRKY